MEHIIGLNKEIVIKFPTRNQIIVYYNPILTVCTESNTVAYYLGSEQQCNNTILYIAPYCSKNKTDLEVCLSVLKQARINIETYPSTAEDKNSTNRIAKHFVQYVLNRMDTLQEISDTQAAAALLGIQLGVSTDHFTWIGVHEDINYIYIFFK
jgi:hypothetical protein